MRFSFLLETCLDVERSVLITGITGVGKSVIITAALEALAAAAPPAEYESNRVAGRLIPHTVVFSAQTTSIDTQTLMENKMEKKRKNRLVAKVTDADQHNQCCQLRSSAASHCK